MTTADFRHTGPPATACTENSSAAPIVAASPSTTWAIANPAPAAISPFQNSTSAPPRPRLPTPDRTPSCNSNSI